MNPTFVVLNYIYATLKHSKMQHGLINENDMLIKDFGLETLALHSQISNKRTHLVCHFDFGFSAKQKCT